MADRIRAKGVTADAIHVDAPWSHDDAVRYDLAARDKFRAEHGMTGKFVTMYSGNHSPCHPLDTVLQAALKLKDDPVIRFMFVGGGSEHAKVKAFAKEHSLSHVVCLPYQPLDKLSGSLSAADLHLVVMGDPFVGLVHPCKVYNILSLGLPWLAVGPAECHLADLVARLPDKRYAMTVAHGQVEELVRLLKSAAANGALAPSADLRALAAEYSQSRLCPRFVQLVADAGTR
jgi:glycosyltransferase involved in cell wall biosynthesis